MRTCMKSDDAPVVTSSSPKMTSSATRPPRATDNWFSRYVLQSRIKIAPGNNQLTMKLRELCPVASWMCMLD